jgi:hypothetical protein
MKIKVPISAIDKGLNDREMVFVNFITQLLHEDVHYIDEVLSNTEFYMHEDDIRKIVGRPQAEIHGPSFDRIREVMEFKLTVNNKYAVSLKKPVFTRKGSRIHKVRIDDYEISNQTAIHLYFYLIGVASVKGVVKDFTTLTKIPREFRVKHSKLVKVRVK